MSIVLPSRTIAVTVLLLTAATVSACGGGGPSPEGGAPAGSTAAVIRADGSSTVFPISEAVAEEFQRANPNARVTVGISGTGGGFEKFCRGESDLSNASRPITATEVERCDKSGVAFVELPVAYDGLTVVVHPKNSWATSMTVAELKKLWEPSAQGQIMKWNQIRPEWPDKEIHLFGAGVDSGTFDYFTEAIVGKQDSSRGDYTSSEDDNVLVQGIANDELALGYFGFAYFESNKARLKPVAIDEGIAGSQPLLPSQETIRNGTYRPLSRPLFIYLSQASLSRPEIKSFAEFYLEEAPALVAETGYVPLTAKEYELAAARLARTQTGTIFADHSAKPGMSLEALLGAGH
jgi:phosphate transport system substrate-binding protein